MQPAASSCYDLRAAMLRRFRFTLPFVLVVLAFSGRRAQADSSHPSAPPYGVRMVQAWIPMSDGVKLSATLYMPEGGKKKDEKFPALLEYLPYRKDDAMAARDYPIHSYFAARGYVSVRVDIRGFGTSEGVPTDREYSEQELRDGEQVIAWRDLLGRLQLDPDGHAPSTSAQSDPCR
jgi:predicted acyl esterase